MSILQKRVAFSALAVAGLVVAAGLLSLSSFSAVRAQETQGVAKYNHPANHVSPAAGEYNHPAGHVKPEGVSHPADHVRPTNGTYNHSADHVRPAGDRSNHSADHK
jgi:hypothetical protein